MGERGPRQTAASSQEEHALVPLLDAPFPAPGSADNCGFSTLDGTRQPAGSVGAISSSNGFEVAFVPLQREREVTGYRAGVGHLSGENC